MPVIEIILRARVSEDTETDLVSARFEDPTWPEIKSVLLDAEPGVTVLSVVAAENMG